ncbi:thioredoxin domain-containing protein [Gordonia jinhuaensis]|uniref:Thioredoxin-like fold domain-containing protein n=1 Tax=Gordonia jinhuaensis TaxID=1517702 RepID=A0A916T8U7_9ACTN|nr:DsbA family protein [Gordonia jinhuaensis]GGB35073.1 hypothetical protein GCM10011489_23880 [Gordonia jinhuaensis]
MASNKGKSAKKPSVLDPRAAERRRTILFRVGATAIVVILAVAIGAWIIISKDSTSQSAAPVDDKDAFRVSGTANDKAILSLYEDFQCPVCRSFEANFGDAIATLRKTPNVSVEYHPIAFLNSENNRNYSTRSANASACVVDATDAERTGNYDVWLNFHKILYDQQPAEGGSGLDDNTLKALAKQAGAPATVDACIDNQTHSAVIDSQTKAILNSGWFKGTPTVNLNGKPVDWNSMTPDEFVEKVKSAAS